MGATMAPPSPLPSPVSPPSSLPEVQCHNVTIVRLFVGGLPADVTHEELQARFKPFGRVIGLEVVPQKESGECCRGFAYVDLEPSSDGSLSKCFTVYNGAKWRGGRLRVEKARTGYLDRLKAEWASESSALLNDPEKQGEDSTKPGPSDGKAQPSEPSDGKGALRKHIYEPLRLKWGTWEHEKKIKVMPAAGGVKIKKSFRNVPEKSLWELEGMGGDGASSGAKAAQNAGPNTTTPHITRPLEAGENGASLKRKAEASAETDIQTKVPGGVTKQGAALGDVTGAAAERVGLEAEGGVDLSGDEGGRNESEEFEGRSEDETEVGNVPQGDEDKEVSERVNEKLKAKVKELSAWEKLLQKAAAGPEDDGFIDEEAGGLAGFAGPGEAQAEAGTFRGAGGKELDQTDRVEAKTEQFEEVGIEDVDFGLAGKESKPDGSGGRLSEKPVASGGASTGLSGGLPDGLTDWERLMQKASGAYDDQETEGENSQPDEEGADTEGKEYQVSGSEDIDGSDGTERSDGSDAELELGVPNGNGLKRGLQEVRIGARRDDSQRDGSGSDRPEETLGDPSAGGVDGAGSDRELASDKWEEESEDDVMETGAPDADVNNSKADVGASDADGETETEGEGLEGSVQEDSEQLSDDLHGEDVDGPNESEGYSGDTGSEGSEEGSEEGLDGANESEGFSGETRSEASEGSDSHRVEGVSDGGANESEGYSGETGSEGAEESGSDGSKDISGAIKMRTDDDDDSTPDEREGVVEDSYNERVTSAEPSDGGEADFETAPVATLADEDGSGPVDSAEGIGNAGGTESANGTETADGTGPERTSEEEEIARQLAEERKAQLGILGAMFPDDARFFREEAAQGPKPPSGFLPVARYDPSTAAKPVEDGRTLPRNEQNEPVKQKPKVTRDKPGQSPVGGKAPRRGDASGVMKPGEPLKLQCSVERKEGREGLTKSATKVSKGRSVSNERKGGKETEDERGSVGTGEGGDGNGNGVAARRGNGMPSGLALVGEVVSQLSPQVLKYLDSGLLQKLTSAEKGPTSMKKRSRLVEEKGLTSARKRSKSSEKEGLRSEGKGLTSAEKGSDGPEDRRKRKRGIVRETERENSKREKRASHAETGEGTERNEAGKRKDLSERASRKGAHGDSARPEDTSVGVGPGASAKAAGGTEPGGGPESDVVELQPALSTEERKRLKREKRARRRGEDGAAPLDMAEPAAEVKQEVYVNPTWRALVGYVGTGKPTFSLATVLGTGLEAGPSENVPSNTVENFSRRDLGGLKMEVSAVNAVASGPGQNLPGPDAGQTGSGGAGLGITGAARDTVPEGEPPRDDVIVRASAQKVGRSIATVEEKAKDSGDDDLGLSFVRSATAEREWLASKSALSIDYKRKKRVAMRVVPGGGKKRA